MRLSLVISSSAILPLLCQKSVKCQHPWQKATSSRLLCSALRDTYTGLAGIVPIRHRRLRLLSLCTHAAFWRGTFETAPRWRQRRGRGRNLSTRERRQNEQLLKSTFLACCSRLVPLRFVIVFPFGLNFSASPWAITPENLPTGVV